MPIKRLPNDVLLVIEKLLLLMSKENQSESEILWNKKMFDTAIRHLEYFIEPRISVKAQKIADANNLGDLKKQRYRTPKGWIGGEDLYWEHAKPVADITKELLKLKPNPSHADILSVINQAEIAWITRDEERLLPKTGRDNWLEDYKLRNIELLPIGNN